jgi:hypothetical protein
MKFKTLSGSTRRVSNIKKHLINWNSPSRSKFQLRVKNFLEPYWERHVVFEEFPIPGTKLSLDFFNANKKIAIEVQGAQHTSYVPFFHGGYKNNYLNQLNRDNQKLEFCEINNLTLLEIFPKDEISIELFNKLNVQL